MNPRGSGLAGLQQLGQPGHADLGLFEVAAAQEGGDAIGGLGQLALAAGIDTDGLLSPLEQVIPLDVQLRVVRSSGRRRGRGWRRRGGGVRRGGLVTLLAGLVFGFAIHRQVQVLAQEQGHGLLQVLIGHHALLGFEGDFPFHQFNGSAAQHHLALERRQNQPVVDEGNEHR